MRLAALAPILLAAACNGGGELPPWDPFVEGSSLSEAQVELTIAGRLGAVDLAERSFYASPALRIDGAEYTQISVHSDALPTIYMFITVVEAEPGLTTVSIQSCQTTDLVGPGTCYRAEGAGLTHSVTTGPDGDELTLRAAWRDGSEVTLTARYRPITIPP